MSYKQIILEVLEDFGDWIPSWQFINCKTDYGYLGHSAGRRLRELAQAGLIDRRINEKYVEYRAKPESNLPPPFKTPPEAPDARQSHFF